MSIVFIAVICYCRFMTTLNDIVDIRSGYTFRQSLETLAPGDVAVVQAKDLANLQLDRLLRIHFQSARHFLQPGDILLSTRGNFTAAVPGISSRPIVATSSMFVLRPQTALARSAYLATYLNSPAGQAALKASASSAYIPTITKQELSRIPIPLPPLHTQGLIVSLANNITRQTEILEHKHQALNRLIDTALINATKETAA